MVNSAKYDRQAALHNATQLFWEKGFHATSMRNIQDAIDMRPGSIYACFGSKEGLFKESLNHYAQRSLSLLRQHAQEHESPLQALRSFVIYLIGNRQGTAPSDLCMLVKTVAELTEDQSELLMEARQLLKLIENEFAVLFQRAIDCGELDASQDPERLARLLEMQIMGLRAYARANTDRSQVEQLVDDALSFMA
ncbi:MAG: TetR/AcrR family transcriptional regulator [Motiliproteus sp.]|nr:TetR/AcrR family transcriptional regulator [Motiliproteus sp.]MCW9054121.1 TetR/AcrR family transcriptional regulator [Motiliproteus sp.]